MKQIMIRNRKLLSNEKYKLEEIDFTKPNIEGNSHQQKNEVYFRPDAVAVLLVDTEKEEFILTKQLRLPVLLNPQEGADGFLLEVCAGLIENGESPEQAVIREAREETGYEISEPKKIGGVYTSAGGLTEYLHLFITKVREVDRTSQGGGAEGEGEDIELIGLKIEDAWNQLVDGKINDAKTMLLLQHYFNFMGTGKQNISTHV